MTKPNESGEPSAHANLADRVARLEAELGAAQERVRLSFAHTPIAQAVVSLDGLVLEVNPALCQFLGYPPEEMVGVNLADLTEGDRPFGLGELREQLLSEGRSTFSLEQRFRCRDGSLVWGIQHVLVARDSADEALCFIVYIEDVSERRNREELILLATEELVATNEMLNATTKRAQLNEERYRALVDHLPDTVVGIFDRNRRLAMLSGSGLAGRPEVAALMGQTPEQLIGEEAGAIVHELLDAAFEGKNAETEIKLPPANVDNLLEVVPLTPTVGDEPEEVLFVARDIERFKQRERSLAEAEARWRAAFDGAPVAMAELTLGGQIQRVNPALCEFSGQPASAIEDQPLSALVHPDDRNSATAWAMVVAAGVATTSSFECRIIRRDGQVRWARARGSVITPAEGPSARLLVHLSDTTVEHEHLERVARAHARFSALVENGSDVITIVDPDLRIRYASPAYQRVFGTEQGATIGTKLSDRFHPDDLNEALALLHSVLEQTGGVASFETRIRRPDGTWRWLEVTATNRVADPAVGGLVCNCRDVTDRVEATTRLAHQATHDELTNLPNRALLLDRLRQSLARAERSGRPCALYFIDVDHFKRINDTLGHALGDQVLVAIAQRLRLAIRPGDSVARLGGDEFVVLAEDITSTSAAVEIAERVRNSVNQPIALGQRRLTVGCSVGIALSDQDQPGTLFQAADTALYRAKAHGRDRWELYDASMGNQAQRRLDTEDMLRAALDEDRLAVVFQPIVDLHSGTAAGTEALVRIRTVEGNLIAPVDFIAVAEDSGLIVPLGTAVLDAACAQFALWVSAGRSLEYVSVNVSARQLISKSLVPTVSALLDRHRMKPDQLCLELTERTIIDAGSNTRSCINDLKGMGVRLALDDFGTGWSSLGQLRRFPIDAIKIDHSFVGGLGTNPEDTEVVRAVIGLGRALRLTTIAEGIETEAQAQQLRLLGCNFGQGNYFGQPRIPDDQADSHASLHAGSEQA